ncbi:hypothetical protein ILYODFUR_000645 [Ilyodon furcidens]|uniref:Uncharacterized protein n=1 Tax=Ilyodon furcidens TaxID=33524 RepID=A0ABV0TF72_9TELE
MSPGPGLKPGTSASRTIASAYGRELRPYTISAVAELTFLGALRRHMLSIQLDCGPCAKKFRHTPGSAAAGW